MSATVMFWAALIFAGGYLAGWLRGARHALRADVSRVENAATAVYDVGPSGGIPNANTFWAGRVSGLREAAAELGSKKYTPKPPEK